MNGYDLQKLEFCMQKIKSLGFFALNPVGDKLELQRDPKHSMGRFDTVSDVYNYLCGYESGYVDGSVPRPA